MGRFTQLDPIGLAGGENLYRFADNVQGRIDPLGLFEYVDEYGDSYYYNASLYEIKSDTRGTGLTRKVLSYTIEQHLGGDTLPKSSCPRR